MNVEVFAKNGAASWGDSDRFQPNFAVLLPQPDCEGCVHKASPTIASGSQLS
jgi:hypothetical protein